MSEYIEIEAERTDEAYKIRFVTNLILAEEGREIYQTIDEMEEGSAVAQALSLLPGIVALQLEGGVAELWYAPEIEWHEIVLDVSSAIKEFFL